MSKVQDNCKSYGLCLNGGKCEVDLATEKLRCNCIDETYGEFCELIEIDASFNLIEKMVHGADLSDLMKTSCVCSVLDHNSPRMYDSPDSKLSFTEVPNLNQLNSSNSKIGQICQEHMSCQQCAKPVGNCTGPVYPYLIKVDNSGDVVCASHNECQNAACECDLETVKKFKDSGILEKNSHTGDNNCVEKQNLLNFEAGCCGFGLKWLLYNEASPYLQCLLDENSAPLVQNVLNNFVVKTYLEL